ncbi:MAG: HAD family hydrolase [Deltaproteobacteria bacterium]|nr:HAD family hydrolase [Deltaproteobacteria bacterium]
MIQPGIRAISFDLWDTLIIDDSDEVKRKEMQLPTKKEARRILVHEALNKNQVPVSIETVNAAYDAIDTAFDKVWKQLHVTWSVRERLNLLLTALHSGLPDNEMLALIRRHEEMELDVQPDFVEEAGEVLSVLAGSYKLAVISDTVFSPGRVLRKLLQQAGIFKYFHTLVFSDEVLRSKPSSAVFLKACDSLSVAPQELVHIGDREDKDVAGPHAVGARAILCTAVKDRTKGGASAAEKICNNLRELPGLIDELNAG